MDDNIGDLQEKFLNDTTKTGRFILSLGSKGSGKSYFLLLYLRYCIYNNLFERYHLILPMFESEQNDSYGFLKNQNHCFIYDGYSPKVVQLVEKERLKYKTLFIIDDASAELVKNLNDQTFLKLITTTRHGKGCTVFACVHSSKRILAPAIRQQIDYLFLYKVSNKKLLYDIFEEYASMTYDKFNEFMRMYREAMETNYNAVLFTIHSQYIDNSINTWDLLQSYKDVQLKPTKAIKKPKTNNEESKRAGVKINNLNTMLSSFFKKKKY